MAEPSFEDRVRRIVQKDSRYQIDAYHFLSEAIGYTQRLAGGRHVSAAELLEGFRQHTLRTFGPAARRNLTEWGLRCCGDVGEMVRNLIADGCLAQAEEDQLNAFQRGYDFARAFPEARANPIFLAVLCHLLFERDQLDSLPPQRSSDGGINPAWVASLRLDPFIENCEPTSDQVGAFHQLLEDTSRASVEARFGPVLEMCEHFARRACEWQPKPDFLIHDFLVLVEPYCPDFVALVLQKFHLTPDAPREFGEGEEGHIPGGGRMEPPQDQSLGAIEENIEVPEADLTGNFYFRAHLHVYVDRQPADCVEVPRRMAKPDMEATVLGRETVNAVLKGRRVKRVTFVQKRHHLNVCLFTE